MTNAVCWVCVRVVGVVRNFFSQFGPVVEVRGARRSRDGGGGCEIGFSWSCGCMGKQYGYGCGLEYTRRSRGRARARVVAVGCRRRANGVTDGGVFVWLLGARDARSA